VTSGTKSGSEQHTSGEELRCSGAVGRWYWPRFLAAAASTFSIVSRATSTTLHHSDPSYKGANGNHVTGSCILGAQLRGCRFVTRGRTARACTTESIAPLRDEPLLLFRIGDLEMLDRLLDRGLGVRCLDVGQELTVLADQGDRPLVFALLRRRGFWTAHEPKLPGW
jgi:hypothetical protein